MNRPRFSLPIAAVACMVFAAATPAQTTYTWNGGGADNNWSTAANWGGTAPVSDATNTLLVLGGTTRLANTVDVNLSANSLSFAAGAGSFAVGGANTLTLGSGGMTNASANSQAITTALALAANQTWTNNAANTTQMLIGGAVATGGFNLGVAGTGNHSFSQPITGGGTITKTGTGQLVLMRDNANAGLTVTAGTVTVTPITPTTNPLGTGLVTLNGGTLAFREGSINLAPITGLTGFNQDTIAAVSENAAPAPFGTTVAVDSVNATAGFALYERGRNTAQPTFGIPTTGTLTSVTNTNQTYQLQPFAGNNSLSLSTLTGQTGTLTLGTPASYSQINLLTLAGGAAGTFNATVNFVGGTSTVYNTRSAPDWFNTALPAVTGALDRIDRTSGAFSNNTNSPRMFGVPLILSAADQAKQVQSIAVQQLTGVMLNVYGLSGGFLPGFTGAPNSTVLNYATNNFAVPVTSTLDMTTFQGVTIGALSLGAQLNVNGAVGQPSTLTTGAVTLTANSTINAATGVIVQPGAIATGGFNLTFTGGGNGNFTSPLTGGGLLTKAGAGTLTMTQSNTQTATTISAGTLAVSRAAPANNPLGAGTITLGGGTLSFRSSVGNIPLTPASFNHDVISAVSEVTGPLWGTTQSIDQNTAPGTAGGFSYYEAGYNNSAPLGNGNSGPAPAGTGLPTNRQITSITNPLNTYVLQPYVGNNALVLDTTIGQTGTMSLATPGQFSAVSILAVSGGGGGSMTAVLNYATGAATTVTGITVSDWFNGPNFAIQNLNRLNRNAAGAFDTANSAGALNPRIYEVGLNADPTRVLNSITFTQTAGPVLNIFGMSGGTGTAQAYTNSVVLSANSTIDVTNIPGVSFGPLSVTANAQLTLTGSGSPATPTTFSMGAVTIGGNFTLNYPNTFAPVFGQFTDATPGTARTVTKTGTGDMTIAAAAGAGVTTTPINLATGSTFALANGNLNLTATNSISAATGNLTFNLSGGTANISAVNGFSSSAGILGFNVTGGTANLTGASALMGATGRTNFTQSGGTVNANAAAVFGAGTTTVNGNGGTWNIGAGNNYTIGSLASTNPTGAAQFINLNGTTLTINGSDGVATTSFRGRILNGSAAGSLTVAGSSITLNNFNPYTGTTTVNGGKLTSVMPGSAGTGPIVLGGGTLVMTPVAPANGTGTVSGFTTGQFTLNGTTPLPVINNSGAGATSSITLTTAVANVAHTVLFGERIPTNQNFTATFRFAQSNPTNPADGFSFAIVPHNNYVGGAGGSLGYCGVAGPSYAIGATLFAGAAGGGQGISVATNGGGFGQFDPIVFPDFNAAQPGSGREVFFEINYAAATGIFSGRFGQALTAGGTVNYFPISQADGGPIAVAELTYNLAQNLGGGAFFGFTGGTGGQFAAMTIDQFTLTSGTNPNGAYNQPVTVTGGTTGTINVLTKVGATAITSGALTIGAGETGFTVGAETGSVANSVYSLALGATTLNGNPTFTVANNGTGVGTLTLGAITDGTTVAKTITKAGPGTLVLNTAATSLIAGTVVNVNAGTLNLGNATALGTTAAVNTVAGTTVNANAAATFAALTGAGNVNIGANILTVGAANNLSGTFGGVIAGTGGSLVKAGTGTVNLTGANTYTGTTTVNAGTLAVNNTTGNGTGAGVTTVVSGATLMGTGRLGGGLIVATGANLAPGNSIGTLTNNAGTTVWAAGGKYTVEYAAVPTFTPGTTIDNYTSLGTLDVTALNTAGNQFVIDLRYNGTGPGASGATTAVIATFTGTSGTGFAADRFTFTGDFAGAAPTIILDAGNNLVISFTPVPEPATVLGLAAGVMGLVGLGRRRLSRKA